MYVGCALIFNCRVYLCVYDYVPVGGNHRRFLVFAAAASSSSREPLKGCYEHFLFDCSLAEEKDNENEGSQHTTCSSASLPFDAASAKKSKNEE